jgi:K+/H+ antiporter YhaU regulatory subunit KhtT
MPRDDDAEFDYNVRRLTHAIGLHAELMEGLRDEVKSIMDKEKKTPEDFQRYIDIMEKMVEESVKVEKSSNELMEYIRDRRLKRENKETQ